MAKDDTRTATLPFGIVGVDLGTVKREIPADEPPVWPVNAELQVVGKPVETDYLEDEDPGPSYSVTFDRLAERGFEPEFSLRRGVRDLTERFAKTERLSDSAMRGRT